MATRLQRLLGLAPLETLRDRSRRDMEMERPINDFFGQQQSPEVLSPLNMQSPVQGFFNQQMQNTGLQSPTDSFTLDIDDDDGQTSGGSDPSYTPPDAGSGTSGGSSAMGGTRFETTDADLMSNFLSGLGETRANQLSAMLEDNTLDFDELAELAGFDIDKLKANAADYERVKNALEGRLGRFSDVFENVPGQLRNLQELRGSLLGQELTDASQAYGNLMDFVDQGSVTGLISGRTEAQAQEATQTLENALQQQLIGAEGQYLNELDSLLSSTAGDLPGQLGTIADDFISNNRDLAEYLNPGGSEDSGDTFNLNSAIEMMNQMGLNQAQIADATAYFNNFPGLTAEQFQDYLDDEYGDGFDD